MTEYMFTLVCEVTQPLYYLMDPEIKFHCMNR